MEGIDVKHITQIKRNVKTFVEEVVVKVQLVKNFLQTNKITMIRPFPRNFRQACNYVSINLMLCGTEYVLLHFFLSQKV